MKDYEFTDWLLDQLSPELVDMLHSAYEMNKDDHSSEVQRPLRSLTLLFKILPAPEKPADTITEEEIAAFRRHLDENDLTR